MNNLETGCFSFLLPEEGSLTDIIHQIQGKLNGILGEGNFNIRAMLSSGPAVDGLKKG